MRRWILGSGAGLLLAGLSGCVHYQPRPIVPPANLDALESRTLDSPELTSFITANQHAARWPPPAWDVDALTLVGFYYNPDLDVARSDWAVARAGIVTAGERPNPDLSVAPGFNSTTSRSVITPWILTLGLDFTIETAGKRGLRAAQARHTADASRLAIATAAWQVRSRVRDSLLSIYSAQETATLLTRQQDLQTQTVSLLERQLAAGAISPFELSVARISLDTIILAMHDAVRQQAEARVRLADAIGVPVAALGAARLDVDTFGRLPDDLPPAAARREALLHRPDILQALAEYAEAQSALQLEIARQYPDIHLGPGYEMDQSDNKWTLGLSIPLPLFTRNRGPIGEAEARRAQAAARFTAVQAHAMSAIDQALAGYRAARDKVATAETMWRERQKQEQSTRALFGAGEISRLDLGVIQLQLAAVELARLDARVKAQEALGLLEDAIRLPVDEAVWLSKTPPGNPAPITR